MSEHVQTPAEIRNRRDVRSAVSRFRAQCERDGDSCWLCGQPIDYTIVDPYDDGSFEADHLYPVSTHPQFAADMENLRASHRACNSARGNDESLVALGVTSVDWEGLAG